jgi:hypothetical protein
MLFNYFFAKGVYYLLSVASFFVRDKVDCLSKPVYYYLN